MKLLNSRFMMIGCLPGARAASFPGRGTLVASAVLWLRPTTPLAEGPHLLLSKNRPWAPCSKVQSTLGHLYIRPLASRYDNYFRLWMIVIMPKIIRSDTFTVQVDVLGCKNLSNCYWFNIQCEHIHVHTDYRHSSTDWMIESFITLFIVCYFFCTLW